MSGRLQNRIAVVTGSNSGIGRGIAIAYAREGAVVICANRQGESKHDTEKDITTHDLITKNGGKAVFMKMEFTQSESINALVKEVVSVYGRIDIWVNNAGMSGAIVMFWDLPDEDFDTVIDTNLKGTFRCTKAAAAQMMKQEPHGNGNRGSIINISSVIKSKGFATAGPYAASKAAISSLTRSAAAALSDFNVTVNTISPGAVSATVMTDSLPQVVHDMLAPRCLLGYGKAEDVAAPAVWLASDEGRWVTGADMTIDGGFSIT